MLLFNSQKESEEIIVRRLLRRIERHFAKSGGRNRQAMGQFSGSDSPTRTKVVGSPNEPDRSTLSLETQPTHVPPPPSPPRLSASVAQVQVATPPPPPVSPAASTQSILPNEAAQGLPPPPPSAQKPEVPTVAPQIAQAKPPPPPSPANAGELTENVLAQKISTPPPPPVVGSESSLAQAPQQKAQIPSPPIAGQQISPVPPPPNLGQRSTPVPPAPQNTPVATPVPPPPPAVVASPQKPKPPLPATAEGKPRAKFVLKESEQQQPIPQADSVAAPDLSSPIQLTDDIRGDEPPKSEFQEGNDSKIESAFFEAPGSRKPQTNKTTLYVLLLILVLIAGLAIYFLLHPTKLPF